MFVKWYAILWVNETRVLLYLTSQCPYLWLSWLGGQTRRVWVRMRWEDCWWRPRPDAGEPSWWSGAGLTSWAVRSPRGGSSPGQPRSIWKRKTTTVLSSSVWRVLQEKFCMSQINGTFDIQREVSSINIKEKGKLYSRWLQKKDHFIAVTSQEILRNAQWGFIAFTILGPSPPLFRVRNYLGKPGPSFFG